MLSLLKSKNLATSLSAGVDVDSSMDHNALYSFFNISISLTENGVSNWMFVVRYVGEYLTMLKKTELQEWVFDEIQKISQISFDFMDEEQVSDFAERLSIAMPQA